MRIILSIFLSFFTLFASASTLETLRGTDSREAVVMVGGFGSDFAYFSPWMTELRRSPNSIYGFVHNHQTTRMEVGAKDLAQELLRLNQEGVQCVTILAHSMGGLVAKKALHLLGEEGSSRFSSIELRTYGTPWGGFFAANFARWIPGSQFVADMLGFAMSSEIGSRSDFMLSLREPLPVNVRLVVYDSSDDEVARPKSTSAVEQYDSVLVHAQVVHRLANVGHEDFVRVVAYAR